MHYIIPLKENTNEIVKSIKDLNSRINEQFQRIKFLESLPKTPKSGRTSKQNAELIFNTENIIKPLKEEREVLISQLSENIEDFINKTVKERASELLVTESKLVQTFKDCIMDGNNIPVSVAKSETKEWFACASLDWNGRLEFCLNTSNRNTSFSPIRLKRYEENVASYLKITTNDWIKSFGFKFTEQGLEFDTIKNDKYSLFIGQLDNLGGSDIEFLSDSIKELGSLAEHLNKNADLQALHSLSHLFIWVTKVFDIEL